MTAGVEPSDLAYRQEQAEREARGAQDWAEFAATAEPGAMPSIGWFKSHPEAAELAVRMPTPPRPPSAWPARSTGVEDPTPAPDLFVRYSAAELLSMDRTFRWLVRGLLVRPTYGQIAGEMKTLKTHLAMAICLGLAAGEDIFGRFAVPEPAPVLAYVGEGGRVPFTRRLERMAGAMGIDLSGIPLQVTFDVAPIDSARFAESLQRDLAEIRPGLFLLDPFYAYHGSATNSSNLHEEGSLLSRLGATCTAAGASLLITNHYNQTGNGTGLKRITQAGSGEWVDSWLLTSHREPPDVANGRFRLLLEVGSRQWGGTAWDLDLDVGRFDEEAGDFDGDIGWHIERHTSDADGDETATVDRAVELVRERPLELTKEELAKALGGRLKYAREVVTYADQTGKIQAVRVPRKRSDGHSYSAWCFDAASEPGRRGTMEAE